MEKMYDVWIEKDVDCDVTHPNSRYNTSKNSWISHPSLFLFAFLTMAKKKWTEKNNTSVAVVNWNSFVLYRYTSTHAIAMSVEMNAAVNANFVLNFCPLVELNAREEEEETNIYPKVRYFYRMNKNGTFLSLFFQSKSFTRSPIPLLFNCVSVFFLHTNSYM